MGLFIKILTSSWMQRLLPIAIAAGLIAGFWGHLLSFFGIGIALLILVVAISIWSIWQRRLPFLHYWNRWLGAIFFAAALLGILAFFKLEDGIFSEVSLGGDLGTLIRGEESSAFVGVLCIIGLAVVGTAFVGPRFTWRLLQDAIKKGIPKLRQLVGWLRDYYAENPIHSRIIDWIKERRSPVKIEKMPLLPPPPARSEPLPKIELTQESKVATEVVPQKVTGEVSQEVQREVPKVETISLTSPSPGGWHLPPIDLLNEVVRAELSQAEIEKTSKIIEESLASYGVEARVVQTNIGPAVTQFGLEPGWDRKYKEIKEKDKNGNIVKVRQEEVSRTRVKVERITSLANDLALALAAPSIRIEAPVPGKPMVGIEVPNSSMGSVSLRECMESTAFQKLSPKSSLVLALGKGTASEVVVGDLAKMPHLLIAGATGSGKTVCLDSIIASLLMKNTPDDLQFIMIDPKRVELIAFNGVPHLRSRVITESERAVEILKWLIQEMENRFQKLAQVRGAQNIVAYNRSGKVEKPMPYLIVIVDELADLMMAKSDEVEPRLCRLAQMGRAVGIHLVVATQRPSVDVVTGLIKANFPTRISFAVASQVDSRTIMDSVGAERLLGRGDMLYHPQDVAKPKRLQGCFTSSEEIERLVDFWREQSRNQLAKALEYSSEEVSARDPLLEKAISLSKEHSQISASFLQRQLRIGYSRAEQLIQQLKEEDTVEDVET